MTGAGLGYNPCAIERVKFKFSQLDEGFNKGPKEEDKKEFWKD